VPGESTAPTTRAAGLVAVVLVGATAQLLASVWLGLAANDALQQAVGAGPRPYVAVFAAVAGSGVAAWWLARRAWWAAALALLGGAAPLAWGLRALPGLGFALWGEAVLHHFLALAAAATGLALLAEQARAPAAPLAARAGAMLAAPGLALLVSAHALDLPRLALANPSWLSAVGGALALVGAAAVTGAAWPALHRRARVITTLVWLPVLVRVASTGFVGLDGAPVPLAWRPLAAGSLALSILGVFVVVRTRLEWWLRGLIAIVALATSALAFALYRGGFGELEEGLGPLFTSLFGFPVPYPTRVPSWAPSVGSTAVFALVYVTYTLLVSATGRRLGAALGLLGLTGIGFTSPQLTLMAVAALLALPGAWWGDAEFDGGPEPGRERAAPDRAAVEAWAQTLAVTCDALGLPPPLDVQSDTGRVLAVDGQLGRTPLMLRARTRASDGAWTVELQLGALDRGGAIAELTAGAGGDGELQVRGDGRALERLDERLLAAIRALDRAQVGIHPAGFSARLITRGRDPDAAALARLIRRLADALAPD
jgi:hypothetical protein